MILSDDVLRERTFKLSKLLRNYVLREPYRPVVEHALREEAAERGLVPPEYELVICFDQETHLGRCNPHNAYLVLRPAVDLLGELVA